MQNQKWTESVLSRRDLSYFKNLIFIGGFWCRQSLINGVTCIAKVPDKPNAGMPNIYLLLSVCCYRFCLSQKLNEITDWVLFKWLKPLTCTQTI